jgi:hypothetical protein
MKQRSGLIAFMVALATLFGAITPLVSQLRSQEKDQRLAWDNFGEYTVPEIEQLKERVAILEKRCKP